MTMPENKAFSYKLAEVLLRQGKFAQVQTLVQDLLIRIQEIYKVGNFTASCEFG